VCPLLGLDTRKAAAVPSGGRWPPDKSWKVLSEVGVFAQFSVADDGPFIGNWLLLDVREVPVNLENVRIQRLHARVG
jgi:hypothetical protein